MREFFLYVIGPLAVGLAGWRAGAWIETRLQQLSCVPQTLALSVIFLSSLSIGLWWTAQDLGAAGADGHWVILFCAALVLVLLGWLSLLWWRTHGPHVPSRNSTIPRTVAAMPAISTEPMRSRNQSHDNNSVNTTST